MDKSNITIKSNIYPVYGPIEKDRIFLSKVVGGLALKTLDSSTEYKYDRGFTEIQKRMFETAIKCAYNKSGDYTWGSVNKNGKIVWACRCIRTSCSFFKHCRPDFDESELDCLNFIEKNRNINEIDIVIPDNQEKEETGGSVGTFEPSDIFADNSGVGDTQEPLEKNIEESDDDTTDEVDDRTIAVRSTPSAGVVRQITVFQGQESIIKADINTKMLVNAGPGTGKTYSLLERLKYIVKEFDLVPHEDILVLCFSRAAVAEIKKRLKSAVENGEADYSLINTEIRTFDSFATYMLAQLDIDFEGYDYDQRIQRAITAINEHNELFDNMKHFIVDEIQDLVGIRARMVQTILEKCICGFTLLGDSCQAIYDYDINRMNGEIDSVAFYTWLYEYFKDNLIMVEMQTNKRQNAMLAATTGKLRDCILKNDDCAGKSKLEEITRNAESMGQARKLIQQDLEGHKSISFLCRSNGEALKLSSYFRSNSIEHCIQTLSSKSYLSSWIGAVFGDWNIDVIDFNDFQERYMSIYPNCSENDIRDKWNLLKSIENGTSSRISIRDMITNINKDRFASNELYVQSTNPVVISTIHKAKGREYDNVVLLQEPIERFINCEEPEEKTVQELKTYYVAITRPRNKIYKVELGKALLNKPKDRIDRWFETGYNRNTAKRKPTHIEVGKEYDIDRISFISNKLGSESEILENQKYIRDKVKPGDELLLRKVIDIHVPFEVSYEIYHKGERKIGLMAASFVCAINEIMRFCKNIKAKAVYPEIFPDEIHKVYVDQVVSYITESNLSNIGSIYRKTKVWNGISITGFGHLYSDYNW